MTIQQIYYAIVISDTGSMNKAAEQLYISQPSLTSAIQELEKSVGITIFNRSGKGVSLTGEGREFMVYARHVYSQYADLQERYADPDQIRRKFSVSTQHYSFAVKAFIDLTSSYDTRKYDFSIMEERTREVIEDVASLRSEIGILYLSDFNRTALMKLFRTGNLEFHPLIRCPAYVYLHRSHPLAKKRKIRFDQLTEYPCLQFDQGDNASFYFSEEILSTKEYSRIIKANDRATMLNLMIGLNGYTLCSGIISEEINGTDYAVIPFEDDSDSPNSIMEIGYIIRSNSLLTETGEQYIQCLNKVLKPGSKKHSRHAGR